MKVWRYYKEVEGENLEDAYKSGFRKGYMLYALTNHKDRAEQFEKDRDMNQFVKCVSSEDKDDYIKLANDNMGAILDYYKYTTKTVLPNGFYGHPDVQVLSTFFEHQNSVDESNDNAFAFLDETFYHHIPAYTIYNKKLLNALKVLQYTTVYKLMTQNPIVLEAEGDDPDYSAPDFIADELAIFVRCFKSTFK